LIICLRIVDEGLRIVKNSFYIIGRECLAKPKLQLTCNLGNFNGANKNFGINMLDSVGGFQ
jgi:hypothetical protein